MSIRSIYFDKMAPSMPAPLHGALHRLSLVRTAVRRERLRQRILAYYGTQKNATPDQRRAVAYLENHKFNLVPYDYCDDYFRMEVPVYRDRAKGMNYAVLHDKKVYFRPYTDKEMVKRAVRELSYEQDLRSPHRYVTFENAIPGLLPCPEQPSWGGHFVREDDILIDVGAAEGIFSLAMADTAKKIYLFESDPLWIPALEETFRDYRDKVTIVNRFVSDQDQDNSVSLDGYFRDMEGHFFLKMDIEGAEPFALQGAVGMLTEKRIRTASICVYHDPAHAETFQKLFQGYGYETAFSDGLMFHRNEPYLVRGILRAGL